MNSIFERLNSFPVGVAVGIIIGLMLALAATYIARLIIENETQN